MKIITTNLLNRFWTKGIKPIKDKVNKFLDDSSGDKLVISSTDDIEVYSHNDLYLRSEYDMYFNSSGTVYLDYGAFAPYGGSANDLSLGTSSGKWDSVYAKSGTIQTSDRNKKNTIEDLTTEKAEAFIYGLKPSTYKMNEGTSGRTHWGLISQDVEELMSQLGMDNLDFAGFIKSPKKVISYEDENGNKLKKPIEETVEGEYDYSLRYDEFIAPLIKVVQEQQREIDSLKKEIDEIKKN